MKIEPCFRCGADAKEPFYWKGKVFCCFDCKDNIKKRAIIFPTRLPLEPKLNEPSPERSELADRWIARLMWKKK